MNIVKILVALSTIAILHPGNADEITIDKVRFSGPPKSVSECREAKKIFEAARKKFVEIEKKYHPPHLQGKIEGHDDRYAKEYEKAQAEYASARRRLLALELKLDVIPTNLSANNASELSDELKWKIFSESEKVKEKLYYIKQKGLKKDELKALLKRMLSRYRDHPAEGLILEELGEAYESNYKVARGYFNDVLKCKFPSDRWDWAKQDACKHLAKLYEEHNEYEKAIATLESMKIREPCGTGAAYSRMERDYKIWSLRLKCAPRKDVLAKLWKSLKKTDRWSFDPKIEARYVISLYPEDQYQELEREVEAAQRAIASKNPSSKGNPLFDEIRNNLLFLEKIRRSSKYLIEQITKIDKDQYYEIKGRFQKVLAVPEHCASDRLWRARAAILALKLHNPKVLVAALKSLIRDAGHSPLAIYALGQIGGTDAVKALTRQLEQTGTDEEELRDCFYALLLTGDPNAARLVRQAEQSSKKRRRAAEWALSHFRGQTAEKGKTNESPKGQ